MLPRYIAPQACFRGGLQSKTSRAVTTERQYYVLIDVAMGDG